MKKVLFLALNIVFMSYAAQQPNVAAPSSPSKMQLNLPKLNGPQSEKVKKFYENIVANALNATELGSVKKMGDQLKATIKQFIVTFMSEWSKKLNNEEKAIVYPLMLKLQEGIILGAQYPNRSTMPIDIQTKLHEIEAQISAAFIPFMEFAPQVLQKTSIDEDKIVQGLQILKDAMNVVINMFKPTESVVPNVVTKPAPPKQIKKPASVATVK